MNEFYRVGKQTNIHKCHKMKDEPRKAKAIRVYSVSQVAAAVAERNLPLQWNLQIFAPEGKDDMVATATLTRDDIADLHTHLGLILKENN